LNGIDRFLPSIVLDARVMSTGAKPGESTGTQAGSGTASAFGSHLDDLSKQEDTASNSPTLAGSLNHAVPAFVQQSFLLVTGTAEAAGQGTSEPETTVLAHDAYRTLFWQTLQLLHDKDTVPIAEEEMLDPSSPSWEFTRTSIPSRPGSFTARAKCGEELLLPGHPRSCSPQSSSSR